jgi:hypothetical protein
MSRAVPLPIWTRAAITQSLVGSLLWACAVPLIGLAWSPALLAFAPLVLFPLLFEMLDESEFSRRVSLLTFLPALASYGTGQGVIAGTLALPWLGFVLWFADYRALADMRARRYVHLLIKLFLVVGASWLVLARFGEWPLNFEHAIVHATAVHFHYAGFTLPILALQWARTAPSRYRYVLLGTLLLGVPMVAAGITASALGIPWIEWFAVCLFVAACAWFAVEQLRFAFGCHGWTRVMLIVSSVALMLAMSLAFTYATGNHWRIVWLDIPLMLRTHGPIQVFGFALPGVAAWTRYRNV